jgi:hypothetical protein
MLSGTHGAIRVRRLEACMQRAIIIVASLALVGMGAGVWLAADISMHGALNTNGVERFPGANIVARVLSAAATVGLLLMLVAAVMSLIHAARQGQWGWFVVVLLLIPVGLYGFLDAGFTAQVVPGLLALLAPLAALSYGLLQPRRTTGTSPRTM